MCPQFLLNCHRAPAHSRRSFRGQMHQKRNPVRCPKGHRYDPDRIRSPLRPLFRSRLSPRLCQGNHLFLRMQQSGSCPLCRRFRHRPQDRLQSRLRLSVPRSCPHRHCLCLLCQSLPLRRELPPQPDGMLCPQPMQPTDQLPCSPQCRLRNHLHCLLLCRTRLHRPPPRESST